MTGAHVEELLEGYLLGALEVEESARVVSHVAGCASCAAGFASSREVILALADSVEPLEPRPSLKAQIMTAAAADGDPLPLASTRSAGLERRRDVRPQLLALAAGVLAVVAVGAVVWGLMLQARLNDREDELADARIATAAFARSAETLHMEGEFGGNVIQAAIAVPGQGTAVTVVITGLPELAEGDAYQLWLFDDGEPQAGVPLTPNEDGSVVAQIAVDLSQFDEMELDAQAADATAPGGALVLGGPLP